MALTNFHIKNGNIYENGVIKEFKTLNGLELKVQAVGTGTYKVLGTLGNGTPKPLCMVDMSTLDIVEEGENDTVYCADCAALTSITVADVSDSIESIYIDIYTK